MSFPPRLKTRAEHLSGKTAPTPEAPKALDERFDPGTPVATRQIYDYIADTLAGREGSDTHINRASSANNCYKQRWYRKRGTVGIPITPRAIVNFMNGHSGERTLLHFIKESLVGDGKLYSEINLGQPIGSYEYNRKQVVIYAQEDLTAQIGPFQFTCHVDGWGKRNADGEWELIEIKTSSNYGFDKFQDKADVGEYLKQAHVNLQTTKAKALGARSVRFFYMRKETGHIHDVLFQYDQAIADRVEQEAIIANRAEEPEAPYGPEPETYYKKPTGRMVLPKMPCGYCAYVQVCHPEAELEFKGGKPIYVVKKEKVSA